MDSQEIINEAKRIALLGWHVVPTLGKVPQGKEWQKHATLNPAWSCSFDGFGLLLGERSGVVDIECDSEEAEEQLMILLGGELPNTPTFQSTRGKHFIFRWREGLPETAVFKINAVEFRIGNGAAAQSVLPPSGGRVWEIAPETPVAEFPAWDAVLATYAENQKPKRFKPSSVGFTPHYGDGSTLNVPRWLAKHGRDILARQDGDDCTRWMIECPGMDRHTGKNGWRDCCVTQMPDGTLGGHCFHQSCGMNNWDSLRDAIGELEYSDYHEAETQVEYVDLAQFMLPGARLEPSPVPTLRPPGLLGDIIEYTLRTSRYPQPALAVAGAIALLSVITGRKVEDEFGTRTNLYCMGVCPPAGGKDRSRQVNKDILLNVGVENLVGPESVGSSAGLIVELDANPATLFQLDEIGKLFAVMQNRMAGHLYNIGRELLKLYSSANTLYIGDAYADRKKTKRIIQPHAVVYGTSTPESFWGALTADNVSDGLIGRFLVFDSATYAMPKDYKREPIPQSILARVRWWCDFRPGGNLGGAHPIVVPFAADAKERLREQENKIAERRIKEDSTVAAVWSRTAEKSYKLALLFSCSRSDGREPGVVSFEDADLAVRITNFLTRDMIRRVLEHVSDNEHEAKLKKVLRKIGPETQRSSFTRATQFLRDSRERREVLQTLVEAGHVRIEQREGDGRVQEWIVKIG